MWYAGLLNWARSARAFDRCEMYFAYIAGSYEQKEEQVVKDIITVPGFEGLPTSSRRSVAIFSAGLDGLSPLAVCDRIEPHVVYTFVSHSHPEDLYFDEVMSANEELIRLHTVNGKAIEVDLGTEPAFRAFAEVVSHHVDRDDVTIVAFGPKPHVLASLLIGLRFPTVSCLRASLDSRARQVGVLGKPVCCVVEFSSPVLG
jgi:hypothetical protein